MTLEIKGLCAKRDGREILKNLDFSLEDGSLTVLLGANGCGKSTFAAVLAGALSYSGSVTLGSRELAAISPRERAAIIAVVPQILRRSAITVEQLVAFGRLPYIALGARPGDDDRARVNSAISALSLEGLRNRRIDKISGGELKMAYIAMALAEDTPIIVLDEPTAHLDEKNKNKILNTLFDLKNKHGKTVIAIMHSISDAVKYSDRLVLMKDGRFASHTSTEDALRENLIEKAFAVRRTNAEIWESI